MRSGLERVTAKPARISGFDQPLVLLALAGCVSAFMMFIYSALLIVLGRRMLPDAIRPAGYRIAALVWAVALFGLLSAAMPSSSVCAMTTASPVPGGGETGRATVASV